MFEDFDLRSACYVVMYDEAAGEDIVIVRWMNGWMEGGM